MSISPSLAICLAALIAGLIFVPLLRRIVRILLRLALVAIPLLVAAAGIAMIMNNETIFEEPGAGARLVRFLTINSAAASRSGSGSAGCDLDANAAAPPAAVAPPAEDVYPELIRRGYPGLPRQKLFAIARETVNSLGGWRIVTANPRAFTLDCIYTTRVLKLEDDVKIAVLPGGEIGVCSRSGTARPDSASILRFFPGDFGANPGHIKEFYQALDPRMDAAYQEEQERENAKLPH